MQGATLDAQHRCAEDLDALGCLTKLYPKPVGSKNNNIFSTEESLHSHSLIYERKEKMSSCYVETATTATSTLVSVLAARFASDFFFFLFLQRFSRTARHTRFLHLSQLVSHILHCLKVSWIFPRWMCEISDLILLHCQIYSKRRINQVSFSDTLSMFDCSEVDTRVRLLNRVGKSASHVTDHALVLRNKHHNNQKSWA